MYLELLSSLKKGNQNFVKTKELGFSEPIRKKLSEGQSPQVCVLACADSRVPVEHIFQANLGELFVTRVAGNVADTHVTASLEYAHAVLGSKVIVIFGHAQCGAVSEALKQDDPPTEALKSLVSHIKPHLKSGQLSAAIDDNVAGQISTLLEKSPLLKEAVDNEKLHVVGATYDISTGEVNFH